MKILKLASILLASFLFFGFTSTPKKENKQICAPALYASNQATGSVKLYRVTYYDLNNSNTSSTVNLSSGQSAYIGFASYNNEISVQTKGGAFNNVVIEDGYGNIAYSLPYVGSGIYWFYNVSLSCFTTWYIKLY